MIRSHYPEIFDLKLIRIAGCVVAIVAALGIHACHDYLSLAPLLAIGVIMTLAVKRQKNRIWAFLEGISSPLYLNNWIGFFAIHFVLSKLELRETSFNLVPGIVASYSVIIGYNIYISKWTRAIRDSVYTKKLGHAAMLTGYLLVAAGFIGHYAFFSRT